MYKNINKKLKIMSKITLIGVVIILVKGYTSIRNIVVIMMMSEIPAAYIRTTLIPAMIEIVIEIFLVISLSYILHAIGILSEAHEK